MTTQPAVKVLQSCRIIRTNRSEPQDAAVFESEVPLELGGYIWDSGMTL